MTIYTISQIASTWRISRYKWVDKSISILYDKIATENEARTRAFLMAQSDRPSKVMQIKNGSSEVIIGEFKAE